jgi:putative IMPACT (imprinted ancient) family translation regulator
MVLHAIARITVDYGLHGNLRYLLPRQGVLIEDEIFADQVTLRIAIPQEAVAALAGQLRELTNGALELDRCLIEERYL